MTILVKFCVKKQLFLKCILLVEQPFEDVATDTAGIKIRVIPLQGSA